MSRPLIDRTIWASLVNFAIGVFAGSPTKLAPSNTLSSNGYNPGDTSSEPTAEELNYELNQLGTARNYLDGIEARTFIRVGVSANIIGIGFGWDPTNKCFWRPGAIAPTAYVDVSFDEMRTWNTAISYSSPGSGVPSFFTGGFAMNPLGDWIALAASLVSGTYTSDTFVGHRASDAFAGGSVHVWSVATFLSTFVHSSIAWVDPAGKFLVGGLNTATTLCGVEAFIATGTGSGITVTTPKAAPITMIAPGDTYCLIANTDGWIWRANADLSGGFAPLGGGSVLKPGIVDLKWCPSDKCFVAMVWSTGSPFPAGLSFWRSADGSVWTLTSGGGSAASFADNQAHATTPGAHGSPPHDITGVPSTVVTVEKHLVVQGSALHVLLQAPNGGANPYRYRAVSLDVGATWQVYSVPAPDSSESADPAYSWIAWSKHATDDRVYLVVSNNTLTSTDIYAGLRLGD